MDKVINVATYVEVLTSDSDEKADILDMAEPIIDSRIICDSKKLVKGEAVIVKQEAMLSESMAKWVRNESSKATEQAKYALEPVVKEPEIKSRHEPVKKLNLSEIRKNFENKSPNILSPVRKEKVGNHNRFSSWDSIASSSSGVSSELLGTGTGNTNNSESIQTPSDFGSFSSFGSSHSLITPQVNYSCFEAIFAHVLIIFTL